MSNSLRNHGGFIALLGLLTIYYFGGLAQVPFHPDESTQIYMSSDFDQLLSDPLSLTWDQSKVE